MAVRSLFPHPSLLSDSDRDNRTKLLQTATESFSVPERRVCRSRVSHRGGCAVNLLNAPLRGCGPFFFQPRLREARAHRTSLVAEGVRNRTSSSTFHQHANVAPSGGTTLNSLRLNGRTIGCGPCPYAFGRSGGNSRALWVSFRSVWGTPKPGQRPVRPTYRASWDNDDRAEGHSDLLRTATASAFVLRRFQRWHFLFSAVPSSRPLPLARQGPPDEEGGSGARWPSETVSDGLGWTKWSTSWGSFVGFRRAWPRYVMAASLRTTPARAGPLRYKLSTSLSRLHLISRGKDHAAGAGTGRIRQPHDYHS